MTELLKTYEYIQSITEYYPEINKNIELFSNEEDEIYDDLLLKTLHLNKKLLMLIYRKETLIEKIPEILNYIFENKNIYIPISIKKIEIKNYSINKIKKYLKLLKYKNFKISKDDKSIYIIYLKIDTPHDIKIECDISVSERENILLISEILLNKNTQKVINNIKFENYEKMSKSFEMIEEFKKGITKFELEDRFRMITIGSMVLFTHFLRNINDIDIYILNTDGNISLKFLEYLDENKYDISVKNTKYYKPYWKQWNKEWSNMFGCEDLDEALINPLYHYYFNGIKVICIEGDITRRYVRERPRAYTDLLYLKEIYNKKVNKKYSKYFKIKIPEYENKYIKYYNNNSEGLLKSLSKKNFKYESYEILNGEIKFKIRSNKSKFLSTMNWIKDERYGKTHKIYENEKKYLELM